MKICYLADAGSIHTQRWIKYFAACGHEVHVISKRSCRDIDGVQLHLLKRLPESSSSSASNLFSSALNLLITVPQVRRLINEIRPDLLHSHYVLDYGSYGAFSGFHPFVVSAWGTDVLVVPKGSRILKALTKYALKKADLITCDGGNSRFAMIDLGINGKKIELISHGIDTSEFHPAKRDSRVRKELGLPECRVVISIRNLMPIYDVGSLIHAASLVLKRVPDTIFLIAGEGRERDSLTKLAEALGVSASVIFTGSIPHEKLPGYLASSDVYVSTSLSDGGVAVSTLEAMACGLAVVTTDVGDARSWIKDGENGFVVPTRSPERLAEKIIYLLENTDDLKWFGAINRSIVKERADYRTEMEKMEKIYEILAGQGK